VDVKQVRDRRFATVAGSIFNISPSSRSLNLPVTVISPSGRADSDAPRPHDVVGYTCVEGDVLTRALPAALAAGDFLMYENVGSYSIVMKPPFILPNVPILRRSAETGTYDVIRRAEPLDYPFENFVL
jgi:diaminopimelate decarboxylase